MVFATLQSLHRFFRTIHLKHLKINFYWHGGTYNFKFRTQVRRGRSRLISMYKRPACLQNKFWANQGYTVSNKTKQNEIKQNPNQIKLKQTNKRAKLIFLCKLSPDIHSDNLWALQTVPVDCHGTDEYMFSFQPCQYSFGFLYFNLLTDLHNRIIHAIINASSISCHFKH